MKRGLEFTGFLAVAAAVHAGVWGASSPGVPEAGGAGGQSTVTIEASNAQLASLVEAWQRPVDVLRDSPELARPEAEPQQAAMPRMNPIAEAPPGRSLAGLPEIAAAPDLPQVDATPPPPPERNPTLQEITSETRPVARPAPESNAGTALPKPRAASTAHPREIARGQAGGAAGAAQQPSEAPSLSAAAQQSLMAEWGGQIRARIERQKRYPHGTRATGTAHLTLTVSGRGALISVALRQSSGDPLLDRAALAAVRNARLPAKPRALPGDSHRFNLPVAFAR
ncbi:outer membrane transport energization protein TonB [Roseovarius azorensis]|uniref:Outer membrane transport energization protein TonB n=1 Tax=Roseovarius azorensis TaxID=1287727 RepID=A0A1H7HR57_9RHOB|nr:energy transducer TonB [Roseovarius azorensis]SEK52863.1 outer membrane transport energization protein TonB [Roseovarius azorensis]